MALNHCLLPQRQKVVVEFSFVDNLHYPSLKVILLCSQKLNQCSVKYTHIIKFFFSAVVKKKSRYSVFLIVRQRNGASMQLNKQGMQNL